MLYIFLLGLSSGVIGGIVIAILLLFAVIGQFLVVLLFIFYKVKGNLPFMIHICFAQYMCVYQLKGSSVNIITLL